MKGKLVCFIGLTVCGLVGWIFGGRQIRNLEHEQSDLDARLEKLRQEETELLEKLDAYHKKTDEEIQKTQELISLLKGLDLMDPTEIDISIDPD